MNANSVKKILILAANPKNTVPLRLDEEFSQIKKVLALSKFRERFELIYVPAVRPEDLQQELLNHEPQIVHFSGHGAGAEGLVVENDAELAQLIKSSTLGRTFKQFAKQVECVLLNACYSEEQAEAIYQHVPCVVGMNQAISDRAAQKFSVGFYRALGGGRSYEEAFEFGCGAIDLENIPEYLTPKLKSRRLEGASVKSAETSDLNRCEPDTCLIESNGYFYIVRDRLEKRCYEEVLKPGMLIRIKSPDKMGKSLMMSRVLNSVSQKGYRTAIIDLREANQQIFSDINQFLLWFCAYVADQLNVDQSPEQNWKNFLGANPNCTKYFEKYLLSSVEEPLVIAIDNFDCIFDRPNIETDFCGLLRGWFEKVNANKVWGKLRQIIVYSQEPYATKDINQSPLNVGLSIELGELESVQVLALANAYGLSWTEVETEKLMDTIGGHPYLVQLALDQIVHQNIVLDELLKTAPTEEGIYGDYLNERLQNLEKNLSLVEAMRQVVNSDIPVRLRSKETFKLGSMGLIKKQGNDIVPRCNLYRLYFRDRLRE